MAIGRAERFREWQPRVMDLFGPGQADTVFFLLELTEMAWHDCFGEVSPPQQIVDDILICSQGDLAQLVAAARLAVVDFRDLRVWADRLRALPPGPAA
jgi:hypothetical protein